MPWVSRAGVHAKEDSCRLTAVKVARQLKSGRTNVSRTIRSA
jgi:hypothetical protein